jgi:hypothetical protein
VKKILILLAFLFPVFFFFQIGFCQKGSDSTKIRLQPSELKIKSKSPTGALFRSVIFPGWGQFYNQQYFKSALVFGGETALITSAAIYWSKASEHKKNFDNLPQTQLGEKLWEFEQYQFYRDKRNQIFWITAAVVFLSMFDAYVDAQLYDFNQEQMENIHVGLIPEKDGVKFLLSFRL